MKGREKRRDEEVEGDGDKGRGEGAIQRKDKREGGKR